MIVIDKLAYASAIRDKSPFVKGAFAVGTLFFCVAVRSFVVSIFIMLIMGYLTVKFSRVSFYKYVKLMTAPFAFLTVGTIAIAVNFTTEPMDLFNIDIGEHYIAVSVASLTYALRLIFTALSAISCLYFLSLTTPMLDLVQVMKSMKLPWLFVEITILMYRFIFVLGDMAAAIMLSQDCRLGNITFRQKINSMGQMLSVVLMRALDKSNKLYDAMESRCYDGRIEVLWDSKKAEKKDLIFMVIHFVILTVLSLFCKLNGGI
mgnify:CR=1 FL=1